MRRALFLWLGALASATLGTVACAPTRTQIVVVVDTDVPRADMDGYRILVFEPDDVGPPYVEAQAVTDRAFPILDEPQFALPSSFGVGPREGDADRLVRIVIQGTLTALRDVGTNPFAKMGIETTAVLRFVDGEARRLDLWLAAACAGADCSPGEICDADGCRDELVDVASLPEWRPED